MGHKQKAAAFIEDQDTSTAQVAIDHPYSIVRSIVIDAITMFTRLTGRKPNLMYVTPALEAALEVDFARSFDEHGRIRDRYKDLLYDCRPVWDAKEFRLE